MTAPLIQELERLNPTVPVGILLDTFEAAMSLLSWARTNPDYACRVSDRIDGSFEVQLEGITVPTVKAVEGQWIVSDGDVFLALSQEEFSAVYKIKGT